MRLVFVTTQSCLGSTVVGRVLPLAEELSIRHQVRLIVHRGKKYETPAGITVDVVGRDPFVRTRAGKRRLRSLALIARLIWNAGQVFFKLLHLRPDVVIIVKPLPENVLAVWGWHLFNPRSRIILDVDDFELTALKLSSLWQRAAVHWSERLGARLAHTIVAATPFLQDHFQQLTGEKKKIHLVPTGLTISPITVGQTVAPKTLLYIGSISRASGHRVDLLPNILELVRQKKPDVRLRIAGSGDDAQDLQQRFRQRGLTNYVTWAGRFSLADLAGLLQNTSVILDPIDAGISNRAKSSFRVALAGAVGLPVVTSDIGIRPLLIPEKLHSRFFANPASIQSYADHTVRLLDSPLTSQEKALMRSCSRQFTWETLAGQYNSIVS